MVTGCWHTKLARRYFGLGHPVFSNSSCLFGWHLEHEEMYTAMGFMPKNSVLLIDESSAAPASRVGHGVAVSSFSEMNLNTRKQNSIVVCMSAQDWEIAPSIRRSCSRVGTSPDHPGQPWPLAAAPAGRTATLWRWGYPRGGPTGWKTSLPVDSRMKSSWPNGPTVTCSR